MKDWRRIRMRILWVVSLILVGNAWAEEVITGNLSRTSSACMLKGKEVVRGNRSMEPDEGLTRKEVNF